MSATESEFVNHVQTLSNKPAPSNQSESGPWHVSDFVLLGSMDNARNVGSHSQYGITCMLNCAALHEYRPGYAKAMEAYYYLQAKDNPEYPMEQHFQEALQFLNYCNSNRELKTLVYCKQGINRSVTICVLYLVIFCSLTLYEAVEYMFQLKHNILSNMGFVKSLYRYCVKLGYPIK